MTETYYIESATTKRERLQRYENIIVALEMRVVDVAVGNADVDEYSLDDGQVKISTKYRSVDQIANAILAFTKLRNMLFNELNGRHFVLRDARGLR